MLPKLYTVEFRKAVANYNSSLTVLATCGGDAERYVLDTHKGASLRAITWGDVPLITPAATEDIVRRYLP